jgi:predicted dehydrogenase
MNGSSRPFVRKNNRREFLKTTGTIAATGAILSMKIPHVYAAENNTIQLALVGCGGRGTGAAINALTVDNGPIKLVAMADVNEKKMTASVNGLKKFEEKSPGKVDVPAERRFIDFEGYKKAMDCLKPGDVVLLTSPVAFRWPHFTYAIQKGLNVFMEKPITVDGPSSRKMLALGKESVAKNLKVGVGLMCRHCAVRGELWKKIQNGDLGELLLLRANRMVGEGSHAFIKPKPKGENELLWQLKNFHAFLWSSGGIFSDYMIHNIDESCWMKNAWPVSALGLGGKNNRDGLIGQNFDNYAIDYTFADGTKLLCEGRYIPNCTNDFASYAHGTKGMAVISTSSHIPAKSRIYSSQNEDSSKLIWSYPGKEPNPYDLEWEHLIDAIRTDKPYNEVERGVQASLVTAMGRMSAHTGQKITIDEMLNSEIEYGPNVDKLTMDGPAPILADKNGMYPSPIPGVKSTREF